MVINKESFSWCCFDISRQLSSSFGSEWADNIIDYAEKNLKKTPIVPRSTTSREKNRDGIINTALVDGVRIKEDIPWLYSLYRQDFLELAKQVTNQILVCAANDLYGINLNIQAGSSMRYECHVDSNPVQGMLYITTHLPEEGGQLHVANNVDAKNVDDVMKDCATIQPSKGLLVFFDARRHSHYVTALNNNKSLRVAAAMNFYTPTSPESHRPPDLTKHLGLI